MSTKKITTVGMLCAMAMIVNVFISFPIVPAVSFLRYDPKDILIVLGGLFTVLADFLSRVIVAPEELPIGIIAALSGAPFFLYLIRRGRRKST